MSADTRGNVSAAMTISGRLMIRSPLDPLCADAMFGRLTACAQA